MIREAIAAVVVGRDLTEAEAAATMEEIMSGDATPSQMGALLIGLRIKGENVDEITGMVRVMREKALRLDIEGDVLDVVSTGGGSFDPFNISTAAALICAGAGVRVAKHGNRGFTSTSGAADVLEGLGAKLELEPDGVKRCIEKSGFGFLFAQLFHPAMRFVGPTRREVGVRTVFNSLGPLTNPAGAQFQLIGAGEAALQEKVAQVLARLGTGKALVVHSEDGLDEVSLGAPTHVLEVTGHDLRSYILAPEDAGFARIPLSEVKTGTAAENAALMREIFDGRKCPQRDYALINAGLALTTVGRAKHVRDGVSLAAEAIDSGAAKRALDAYVAASQEA
ncbi:MAG TPA: anthranilate phosphoribosyltransferase [Dehalococcoidia bacterium]|nr:anthranilate phosphoribosyltransferase [Dehalococcoidia bacterium]